LPLGCTVGRKGSAKKSDYGTVILHWLLVGALAVATTTGLRIAGETPGRDWINVFDPLLPKAAVWTEHLQSAVMLIAISIAYLLYAWRSRLGQRVRLDRVRLRGLLGRSYARWGAINVVLYWLFFLALSSQLLTGTLLYFGYADSFMVQMHWLGMWLILGYVVPHICSQWYYGGAAQLLRILRPTRLNAPPRQLDLADVLALLDEQITRSAASQPRAYAKAFAEATVPSSRLDRPSEPAFRRPNAATAGGVGRDAIRDSGARNSAIKYFPVHLNAFFAASVIAGAVVIVMLVAERKVIDGLSIHRISVVDAPVIDGETSDPIWRKIPPLYVLTENGGNFQGNGETTVSIQAVHDGLRAYFLFIWDDPTRSLKQLPLRKTARGWELLHVGYELGDEHAYNEDKFSVLLTSTNSILAGDVTFHAGAAPVAGEPRTLSGRGLHYTMPGGTLADVWEWKATSTNASGFCDDDHFGPPAKATPAQVAGLSPYRGGFAPDPGAANYQDNFTPGLAHSYAEGVVPRRLPRDLGAATAALGRVDLDPHHGESETARWFMSEEDSVAYALDSDRLIPEGAILPGVVVSGEYSGDRADVRCAGRWAAGRWALEVTRRLDTASPYDVPIATGIFMRVAAFDHAQIRHTRHVRPIRIEVQ